LGTEYIGRTGGGFSLNIAGRRYFEILLTQMEADTTDWSWSNDGQYVRASVCRDWAVRLRKGVEGLREAKIPDRTYMGGYLTLPVAEHVNPGRELSSGSIGTYLCVVGLFDKLSGKEVHRINPNEVLIEPASARTRTWILSFAKFLQECGGCWQW